MEGAVCKERRRCSRLGKRRAPLLPSRASSESQDGSPASSVTVRPPRGGRVGWQTHHVSLLSFLFPLVRGDTVNGRMYCLMRNRTGGLTNEQVFTLPLSLRGE